MCAKIIVGIVAGVALIHGAWAWAQQDGRDQQPAQTGQTGQPAPQGGGQPGAGMGPGQAGPGMGPGGMMMGPGQHGMHGMHGQPGPGMGRGMMMTGMMGASSPFERPLISEILGAKDELGLTAEQEQKLRRLRTEFEKDSIRRGAEIQVAEVDLRELLAADAPDLAKTEGQVKKIAGMQGDLRFARIRVLHEGKAILSKEQWQKFEVLARRGGSMGSGMGRGMMMGGMGQGQPGMQGMHRQSGPGMGTGGMMMGQGMGHGMGRGMGMMGAQQAQAGRQPAAAGKEGGPSRTDATGAVTVSATLLSVRGDRIPVGLKLDTHSVDLDAYKLEAGPLLRNDRGESAPPVVEMPAGSGHHRTATLAFPASLAGSGAKYVEIVVRDLGGVKERVLRWNAPFPAQ